MIAYCFGCACFSVVCAVAYNVATNLEVKKFCGIGAITGSVNIAFRLLLGAIGVWP